MLPLGNPRQRDLLPQCASDNRSTWHSTFNAAGVVWQITDELTRPVGHEYDPFGIRIKAGATTHELEHVGNVATRAFRAYGKSINANAHLPSARLVARSTLPMPL